MTSQHGELLARIDAAMACPEMPEAARKELRALRKFVNGTVIGFPIGYTCDGCGTHHAFNIPAGAWNGGVWHTCTRCRQTNDLTAGINMGEVTSKRRVA
jgi:hypothetical protein